MFTDGKICACQHVMHEACISYLPECPSPTDSDVKRKVFPDFLLPNGFMVNVD